MHIQNFHVHVAAGSAPSAAALRQLMSVFDDAAPATTSRAVGGPPRLSHYWEGEGGIYAGIGRGYEGPDYHLILPVEARFVTAPKRAIGTYGVDVTGARSDHDGMANTIAIAKAGSELCQEILEMEVEGHKDLYLMGRNDARLCMANVPEQFNKNEWYALSTQYSSYDAWSQDFHHGVQFSLDKRSEVLWRPVRRKLIL